MLIILNSHCESPKNEILKGLCFKTLVLALFFFETERDLKLREMKDRRNLETILN